MFGNVWEHSINRTTLHKVSCEYEGFLMTTPVTSGLLCGCGDSDQLPLPGSLKSGLKVGLRETSGTIPFHFISIPRVSWLVSQNLIKIEYKATGLASSEQRGSPLGPPLCWVLSLLALITGPCALSRCATLNNSLPSLDLGFLPFLILEGLTGWFLDSVQPLDLTRFLNEELRVYKTASGALQC